MMCGTKVLRKLLEDQVDLVGQSLDSFLASRKQTLQMNLTGKINSTVMFPLNNQPTDIECWDICLLVHVLTTSRTYLPFETIQNLKQLRVIRNIIAHTDGTTICETQFNNVWRKIATILGEVMSFINDTELKSDIEKDVKDIENGMFVQDVAGYLRIINQWHQMDFLMVEKLNEVGEGLYETRQI